MVKRINTANFGTEMPRDIGIVKPPVRNCHYVLTKPGQEARYFDRQGYERDMETGFYIHNGALLDPGTVARPAEVEKKPRKVIKAESGEMPSEDEMVEDEDVVDEPEPEEPEIPIEEVEADVPTNLVEYDPKGAAPKEVKERLRAAGFTWAGPKVKRWRAPATPEAVALAAELGAAQRREASGGVEFMEPAA